MSKLLKYLGRDRAATPAARKAPMPPASRSTDAAGPPAARYDALTVDEVLAHLGELPPADLAKLGDYERAHQDRVAVLAGIDALLGREPWPGYDALDVTGVRSGLDAGGRERLTTVLAYERAHKNRADVLLAAQQHPA